MVARPAARGVRPLFPPSVFPAAQAIPGLSPIILPAGDGVNALSGREILPAAWGAASGWFLTAAEQMRGRPVGLEKAQQG